MADVTYETGTVQKFDDGSRLITYSDGTTSSRDTGGNVTIRKPDGTPIAENQTISSIATGVVSKVTNLFSSKATDAIKNGVSSLLVDKSKLTAYATKNTPNIVKNPMEDFASVNVLWTLACLTPEQFNNPPSYRNSPQDLKHVIFSSGGRFDSQRVKTFFGTPEYYVNNFQMNCVIGSNEKTGNSNAIKFTFDIYEPYSMGLLLQSMQNAAINAGYANYLDNTPYVLRMDIQGYDDMGSIIKSVKPKFFTLKLVSMKFNVTEAGSNYKVEAIPYNHQGFSDSVNTAYNDIKIYGGNTVAELLSTSENSLSSVLNRNEEKLVQEKKIGFPDIYEVQFPVNSSDFYSSAGNPPKVNKATVDPQSEQQRMLAAQTAGFDDAEDRPLNNIGAADMGFNQTRGGNHVFKRAGDQVDEKTGVVKRDSMTIDPKERAFQFGQGQTLTAMINQVVLSSEYASKALDPANLTPEGYIKWFKLDVQIELLKYDPIVGDYSKKITYRVVPYFIHQSIFSNPSSAPVGYTELMKEVRKEYNYIYTGQNVDILKFDININNLFFTGTNPSPENKSAKTGNQDQAGTAEKKNNTVKKGQGQAPESQVAQMGRARTPRAPELLQGYKGGSADKTTEQNVAENFQQAFISGNSADLVSVDLEILGDPYWLVDSGIGNYFAGAPTPTSSITNDGTMNYEGGNVYVYLTFKTPADVNVDTGLYDFSVSGKESPFGGIYRIVMVENYFQDGFWKQKLKCIRMPGPQGPEVNKMTDGATASVITKADTGASQIDKEAKPSSSMTDDSKKPSTTVTNNSSTSTASKETSSTQNTAKTTTTSNQSQPVAGYRYYRDLGQR